MNKFICPYCYGEHDLRTTSMKCSFNIQGQSGMTCVGNVQKEPGGFIPQKDKVRCTKCTAAKKIYFCDVVKKEIPREFLEDPNGFSVALVGAKASGKSNYIGVLIQEIKKKMVPRFNCSLSLTTSEESKMYYDRMYYKPLYENGVVVDATNKGAAIPPLIFPLRFWEKKGAKSTAVLTFYDTAGENLDRDSDMLVNTRYIPNASGIILLLDPLQVPAIREKLQGKMPLPEQNTDTVEVLSRLVENIRSVKNIRGKIKTPLALAFTKIDALAEFDILGEDSVLREESQHLHRGVFAQPDFESVNIEIRDMLGSFLGGEIEQMLKNFETYAFFGLSSLGGIPQGRIDIKPCRVLDPLLWLLAQRGYIPKAKK